MIIYISSTRHGTRREREREDAHARCGCQSTRWRRHYPSALDVADLYLIFSVSVKKSQVEYDVDMIDV